MAAGFFRKAAVEKLSTPEKLDQLIKVTGPKGWIALFTIAIVLLTGITWSFLGNVKTKLNVVGVLLGGEIHEVVATSQGQLINLDVKIGDLVNEGDIIATVEQPELFQQIEQVEGALKEQKYDLKRLFSFGNKNSKMQEQILKKEHSFIEIQEESSQANLNFLKSQLENEKELLKKGLITKSQVVKTEQKIEQTLANIELRKIQTVQTSNIQLNNDFEHQQNININKQRIAETERRLKHLKERYDIQTKIRSPYTGEVVELLSESGIVVRQGAPLFKLKNQKETVSEGKLRGVLYIPSQDGKKIKEGMEALVVPSTVQPQEYGFMKGKVTYVSDFPITQKGMMMTVKNDQLVSGLLTKGALFEVYVEFEEDKNTFSGFKWTSAKGPEVAINEGTSCMGKITVKTEPPVAIVVPALKKFFDLY
ncbi:MULTISPECIES: NHLP bacteriocin system secretion protein [unclassified Tenacibaculum]|uniref:NHLP bacteriocin system secretion protein n=1 Tax=unclassified Tenacibaculum TaxID=2635139 RepID=UPI001F1DBEC7|nr:MULTISPECIES: NHLP bacteriocin system secretion protein [unclassified Tenacibaculum]MCF2873151.1 NHLP bacteriocin system secretion protein [Tenacibaculum sp. Cn5-1]MCF2933307.1 NHLP bacteriocin system secretion protein [Tenacibaculum sp. Cn5-34]MCG7510112.1 NHLP bacteriocin system secretion protein [Tenacibaculum sp. Cn5-46]